MRPLRAGSPTRPLPPDHGAVPPARARQAAARPARAGLDGPRFGS